MQKLKSLIFKFLSDG